MNCLKRYKADLHNHTVLSPCGDIEMTPRFIVESAREKAYDIIGVTDHNSTLQARIIRELVEKEYCTSAIMPSAILPRPYILCGAEITSKEEVHCLAFVDGEENLDALQAYLEKYLPKIPNNEELFGYQLLVNADEEVIKEEEFLLISAIDQSISQIEAFVHSLGGIFIPAHIDKMQNSVISQLGFIPFDLKFEALEFSKRCDVDAFLSANKYISKFKTSFIRSSDAHYPADFLGCETFFYMEDLSFMEIKKAFAADDGRSVEIVK